MELIGSLERAAARAGLTANTVGGRNRARLSEGSSSAADQPDHEGRNRHRDRRCRRRHPAQRDDGGHEPGLVHQHPGAHHHHAPARAGRRWPASAWTGMKRMPALYKLVFSAEPPDLDGRVRADGLARRAGSPRGPARARRAASARSRTSSPARACSWSSTAPTPTLVRDILEAEIDGMIGPPRGRRGAVREGRRVRADDGDHRHGHGPRARAPEPRRAGDARPRRSRPRSSRR